MAEELFFFELCDTMVGIRANRSRLWRYRFGSLIRNTKRSKWSSLINNRMTAEQHRQVADELDRLNKVER